MEEEEPSKRRYGSFLVRWWQTEYDQQRVSIRHVQSDEEMIVASLLSAIDWMAHCLHDADRAPPNGTSSISSTHHTSE